MRKEGLEDIAEVGSTGVVVVDAISLTEELDVASIRMDELDGKDVDVDEEETWILVVEVES